MSLNATVAAGVELAFNTAYEFVVVGEYHSRAGPMVFDPDLDTMTPAAPAITGVRFLPVNNTLEEREASPVAINDLKLLVPGVDLKGTIPTDVDQVKMWDKLWNVTLAKAVPGQALWSIFVRKA